MFGVISQIFNPVYSVGEVGRRKYAKLGGHPGHLLDVTLAWQIHQAILRPWLSQILLVTSHFGIFWHSDLKVPRQSKTSSIQPRKIFGFYTVKWLGHADCRPPNLQSSNEEMQRISAVDGEVSCDLLWTTVHVLSYWWLLAEVEDFVPLVLLRSDSTWPHPWTKILALHYTIIHHITTNLLAPQWRCISLREMEHVDLQGLHPLRQKTCFVFVLPVFWYIYTVTGSLGPPRK